VLRQISHSLQISSAGSSRSKKSAKDPNKALQEFVQQQNDAASDVSICFQDIFSLYLTQSKGTTTDNSDEIPLSRSLAFKSKGKTRPAPHRKTNEPPDDSDTHDDGLSVTDIMPSKGKHTISAPGTSTGTGVRSKPIKRRRLASPEGEGERGSVSRQRCQQRGYQLIV